MITRLLCTWAVKFALLSTQKQYAVLKKLTLISVLAFIFFLAIDLFFGLTALISILLIFILLCSLELIWFLLASQQDIMCLYFKAKNSALPDVTQTLLTDYIVNNWSKLFNWRILALKIPTENYSNLINYIYTLKN